MEKENFQTTKLFPTEGYSVSQDQRVLFRGAMAGRIDTGWSFMILGLG